jgi:NAD dependent epimerase/dehydratase family enzyme
VARRWEEAFYASSTPATRKIALRSSMTMSPDEGGVFSVLLRLVRMGLGGTEGSGRQFVSWIHDRDYCRVVDFLLDHDDISGAVNLTSPNPLPNREFMRELRRAWGAPFGLPATEWMLEIGAFFLRTETELILKSRRAVPTLLLRHGFEFEFPLWSEAAAELVKRYRARHPNDKY